MTRGIDPDKEMREEVELGSVYTSVVCIGRERIMRLWQLLLRGTSTVVRRLLRVRVVKLAHEGHKCKIKRRIGLQLHCLQFRREFHEDIWMH